MKDKEKQIEKIAKRIHIATNLYYIECIKIATYLFEKDNCRIISEDSVVLSREEYESIINENEKLKSYNDKLSQGIYWGNGEQFCNRLKESSKATAEKFYDFAKAWFEYDEQNDYFEEVKNLAKQFGVEIKE